MIYYYSFFTAFAIIAVLMVIDPNVATYIDLLSKIVRVNFERMIWMVRFHPVILSSPIGRWWMMRKYMGTAKELAQQLSQKDSNGV